MPQVSSNEQKYQVALLRDLHRTMGNTENVIDTEFVGVSFMRSEQFCQEINTGRVVGTVCLFSLPQFFNGDFGHRRRTWLPEGQIWSQWVVSEQNIELGNVAHNAVVPLHIVDILD